MSGELSSSPNRNIEGLRGNGINDRRAWRYVANRIRRVRARPTRDAPEVLGGVHKAAGDIDEAAVGSTGARCGPVPVDVVPLDADRGSDCCDTDAMVRNDDIPRDQMGASGDHKAAREVGNDDIFSELARRSVHADAAPITFRHVAGYLMGATLDEKSKVLASPDQVADHQVSNAVEDDADV